MRIIVDADPGNGVPGADIDDSLAIGLAARSPEIELDAVTVVAGNVTVDRGVECALEILEAIGACEVPVYRGAARPLLQDPRPWRAQLAARSDNVRAQELWADIRTTPPSRAAEPTPAAQTLVDRVNAHPGEITVVGIGPLTNIATAMILDPLWATKVQRLVIMSGAFDKPNVLHELNASYDPEATHLVLTSEAPLLMVPLDVTTRTFLRIADVDLLATAGTPLTDYLATTVRPWVTWQADLFGREGCSLHDALAMATLIDPRVVVCRQACVDIELHGALTRGRTVSWEPADAEIMTAGLHLPDVRPVTLATDVDNGLFVPLLLQRLMS